MLLKCRPPVCLSSHVYCGKTADWIRMPFGVVSGVGLVMGVLDFGGDAEGEGAVWGVNIVMDIAVGCYAYGNMFWCM